MSSRPVVSVASEAMPCSQAATSRAFGLRRPDAPAASGDLDGASFGRPSAEDIDTSRETVASRRPLLTRVGSL